MKGYKVFNPDFTCNGYQYAENSEYVFDGGEIKIYSKGFHFCVKASHCFNYYSFTPENIVCEVEAIGEIQTHTEDSKACTNHIKIGRRLSWAEVLVITNEGSHNTGHSNSGNWNSGDRNSGNSNSGNWNSGDRNSGDSNSGYRNSGAFCTDANPPLILFNKVSKMSVKEWEQHECCQMMYAIDPVIWVPSSIMTDEEKAAHPKHETTEGYLKTIPLKEAWANFWHNLAEDKKQLFLNLENFDAAIFEEITGVNVNAKP
jgi:hypothetical protein